MAKPEFENPGQEAPETVVKSVFDFEFQRGIPFREWGELQSIIKVPQEMSQRKKNMLKKMLINAKKAIHANCQIDLGNTEVLGEAQDYTKIMLDQTQQPPLYILILSDIRQEKDIAERLGKERGYSSSCLGVRFQLDPSTYNLHVDFDLVTSTLKEAGVSMNISGKDLIGRVEKIIREEASVDDIPDEDDRRNAYADFKKRKKVLLAQQEGLDVYLELGDEIKHRLLNFKSGDKLDISGTTLNVPPLSNHPQAANMNRMNEWNLILPAIDVWIVPSSREGKIDDAPPNFDPQILSAGRDLTSGIKTAFESLKPQA